MYCDKITLFNRVTENGEDKWLPTVLEGVDLNADRGAIMARYGANATDRAKLHIKYVQSDDICMVGDKQYLTPREYSQQYEHCGYITFAYGQDDGNTRFDFFAVGEYPTEPVWDYDYDSYDGFYNYMNSKHDEVYAITSVAKYSVIPHFEILAK